MCGIIGIIGNTKVTNRLLSGLKKLEYRGYDSAGIAVIDDHNNEINITKVAGKIARLEAEVATNFIDGKVGIGHTRWATHGGPEVRNAHPFKVGNVALVHNGIIENYKEIKEQLISQDYSFESETDSEVLLKLIHSIYAAIGNEYQAVKTALGMVKGAFAIALIFSSNPELMIGVSKGAPLAIGVGEEGEMFLGSDALALSLLTNKLVFLNDGEIAELTTLGYKITNFSGEEIHRDYTEINLDKQGIDKAEHQYYMLKEIYEQPMIAANVFNKYYDNFNKRLRFNEAGLEGIINQCSRIYIIACGTSYHAAMVAKYWFEKFAQVPVEIDFASEFRYRNAVLDKQGIGVFISQSGETADTLAALRYVKDMGLKTLAIVNAEASSIAREADYTLPVYAGFEIGVASTKAFTAQLMVLAMFCCYASYQRGVISGSELEGYLGSMHLLPDLINQSLLLENEIVTIAKSVKDAISMIYMGRGISYPLALEGALKIKEISYIHAEGIAAGELKHGSIALIDDSMPVVVIAPSYSEVFAKVVSNAQEINARNGKIIVVTDIKGAEELGGIAAHLLVLPDCNDFTTAIVYNIPLQLLAYHTALLLEKDVDQPRNLAKSVTVE